MKYTSLFLDLDNTLLDFNKAEAAAAHKVFKKHNLPCDENAVKTYSKINLSYWKRFEKGEIKRTDIFENRFKTFCETYNCTADTAKIAQEYFEFLADGHYTVDGAAEILDYLKSKNYKLYATTNGVSVTQYKRIKESGLEPYFDKIFISEDTGHQKPEKEYFLYILNDIAINKNEVLIIGDSQSSDILGGLNSDIDTCWYNPENAAPKYPSKYTITNLLQLKDIL